MGISVLHQCSESLTKRTRSAGTSSVVERKKKVNPLSEAGVAASSALLRAGRMEVFTEFQAGKNTAYDAQQRAVEKETAQLTASEDVRVKRRNAPSLAEEMGIEQSPASRMKAIER